MAAYAALTSLNHIIHQLQNHPFPPISLHKQQVESLTQIITFLQEFLEGCNYKYHVGHSDEADTLEMRIADAAYAAEDIIETEIVDQIRIRGKMITFCKFFQNICKCTSPGEDLYHELQLVIEEMDGIKNETMAINTGVQPQLERNVSKAPRSSSSTMQNSITVGFDDLLIEVMEKLTRGENQRQIIPIMGMGGIGKTTLARHIYAQPLIKEHFDICAWVTISQSYNAREILREVLSQARGNSSDLGENELGLELHKHLSHRRYLVIMDDMWSIEAWEKVKFFFPESNNGSRIIVTTRLSNFLDKFHGFNLKFLDEVDSWELFSKTVFQEESFPSELEKIGKRIVRNCRGLPLSIVTTGGLLAKSELTRECWEYIEGHLNSIVNSEDNEYCLKILKMSYNHLPVHLKPCFCYMGIFEEDCEIRVATLINLWVSEGFLKPMSGSGTCLETIAQGYLKELIDRNLVLVHKLGSTGNIKYCKIHDLLRDLCLREGERERFYHVIRPSSDESIYRLRRIVIPRKTSKEKVVEALGSMSYARSVICDYCVEDEKDQMSLNFRLLRTLKAYDRDVDARNYYFLEYVFQLVNLRYLAIGALRTSEFPWISEFPTSINLLWNLQTLIVFNRKTVTAPIEIWNMPHLRHAKFHFGVRLPDPPSSKDAIIMGNLQTLKTVRNLKLNEEVVKRIPNIKKLDVTYEEIESNGDDYCVSNLECLLKLESFQCISMAKRGHDFLKKLTFPRSLKKLRLVVTHDLEWEVLLEKIGPLPHLQKLELIGGFFRTRKWETVEGEFLKLKSLLLRGCGGLENWTTESSHFPCLEEIYVDGLADLKEIPLEMGDIPTLGSIMLERCNDPVVECASMILEKREELQVEEELSFHVRVVPRERSEHGFELVCCGESSTRCAELLIAEEQEGEGKYYNFRSNVLNEEGDVLKEELQREQPHFHYRPAVFNEEGEALKRNFARDNFTVIY